jgi:hypothetical protein
LIAGAGRTKIDWSRGLAVAEWWGCCWPPVGKTYAKDLPVPDAAAAFEAICGQCGVTIDVALLSGKGATSMEGVLRDVTRCKNPPWQRCPQLLAIVAGVIGQDLLADCR